MPYTIEYSDDVESYIRSQDTNRQKVILSHLLRMENDPFRKAKKLKPPLDRLYRVRIGEDRVLFSIRGAKEIYLEYMDDRKTVYKNAKRMETKAKVTE
jgi:mRNA-degrading endonuclease RelE of RelBE toxin-antitoxin system